MAVASEVEAVFVSLPTPVGQMLTFTMTTEGANVDITTLARTIEPWAGVEIGRTTGHDPDVVRPMD